MGFIINWLRDIFDTRQKSDYKYYRQDTGKTKYIVKGKKKKK